MKPLLNQNYQTRKVIGLLKETKRKSKNGRKRQKSTWQERTMEDLVDCVCPNKYPKKGLIFTNNKASKNQKLIKK